MPPAEAGSQEEFVSYPRLRRLATVVSTALLGAMLLGTGTAVANPPGWQFLDPTLLPDTVTPGADAGYSFTIHNGGKSNISQVYLLNDSTDTIDWLQTDRSTAVCTTTPSLNCSFGAMPAGGADIHVLVVYKTPAVAGSYSTTFYLNGTGFSIKDGGTSHGDSLPLTFHTTLSSNANFGGGYQVHGGSFGSNQSVGRSNIQGSTVQSNLNLVPVTIQDGFTSFPGSGADPCGSLNCVGDWTVVRVGSGSEGPIKVSLLIYGKSIKGNFSLSNFALWHDGSTPNPITLSCTDASAIPNGGTAECVTATMQGTNVLLTAWLKHNGTGRGVLLG